MLSELVLEGAVRKVSSYLPEEWTRYQKSRRAAILVLVA